MKKKMALLLIFAMVVTTSITVPFVSFAAANSTEITAIYGVETSYTATANKKVEEATGLSSAQTTFTAKFTYSPAWKTTVVFNAEKKGTVVPEYTVTAIDAATGVSTVKTGTVVTDTSKKYTLDRNGKYEIELKYTFTSGNMPTVTPATLTLKVKAFTETITEGTSDGTEHSLSALDNEERWYEVAVDSANGKGTVFSLLAGDGVATTQTSYCAEIYSGKTLKGTSAWNKSSAVMAECPLILATGTYYVKVYPKSATTTSTNLKLRTTKVREVDAFQDTILQLTPGDMIHAYTLYSFVNRSVGYWYKIPGGGEAIYEIAVKFVHEQSGFVDVEVYDGGLFMIDEASGMALPENDNNKFYIKCESGEDYYLKLVPSNDEVKSEIELTLKPHTCKDEWFLDEDGRTIINGCRCLYDESVKSTCIINASKTKFGNVAYTGSEITFAPTFAYKSWDSLDGKKPVIDSSCYAYTIKNSKGEKINFIQNIGTYTVTISFPKTGSLAGLSSIKNKTIQVVPEGTTLVELTGGKKSFTAEWNQQKVKTKGYQLQYSTSSKFSNAKTVTVSKNTTIAKTVSKLQAKKKYYVRVRTYTTVNKTKYYSKWSAKMSVTTKK